ncbi:No apical meristem-associated C-terminal domain [Fragilaria crotonensis]|nr:No apical meristem-associated C-terminal domain [Fragilaria crotonensis]
MSTTTGAGEDDGLPGLRAKCMPNFRAEEDLWLAEAYAAVTVDAAVGTDQNGATFWGKIRDGYIEKGGSAGRTAVSLQNRFNRYLQTDVNKYIGMLTSTFREYHSGWSLQDYYNDAKRRVQRALFFCDDDNNDNAGACAGTDKSEEAGRRATAVSAAPVQRFIPAGVVLTTPPASNDSSLLLTNPAASNDDVDDESNVDDDDDGSSYIDAQGLYVPGGFVRDKVLDNWMGRCAPPIDLSQEESLPPTQRLVLALQRNQNVQDVVDSQLTMLE